jgi:hypothetical protein
MVLIRCLSPNAATVTLLRPKEYIGKKGDAGVTVTGKKNVDRAFDNLFGRGPAPKPA